MKQAVIALGSNLGNRAQLLRAGITDLSASDGLEISAISPVVVTHPVGGPVGQPDYFNAVVQVNTTLEPFELLELCHRIEADHDRVRNIRWGPRTLDLDIIDYAGMQLDDPTLTLPHPRAAERAFVLVPWAMMDPAAQLQGQSVRSLADQAKDLPGVYVRSYALSINGMEDLGGR